MVTEDPLYNDGDDLNKSEKIENITIWLVLNGKKYYIKELKTCYIGKLIYDFIKFLDFKILRFFFSKEKKLMKLIRKKQKL